MEKNFGTIFRTKSFNKFYMFGLWKLAILAG